MNSTRKIARWAGLLYLIYIMLTIITSVTGYSSLVDFANPGITGTQIMSSEFQFRAGFILDLAAGVLFLATAWSLYVLLKEVNPDIALLFFVLNVCGVAVQCMNMINVYASIVLLSDMKTLTAFSPDQYNTMVLLFMNLQKHGFMMAQIFFGAWLFPLGYLVYKSGFLPKLIGGILMVHCFSWLAYFLQYFLFPDFIYLTYVSYPLGLVAELALTLWLLIKGAGSKNAGAVA
jgi:hypothetical protein